MQSNWVKQASLLTVASLSTLASPATTNGATEPRQPVQQRTSGPHANGPANDALVAKDLRIRTHGANGAAPPAATLPDASGHRRSASFSFPRDIPAGKSTSGRASGTSTPPAATSGPARSPADTWPEYGSMEAASPNAQNMALGARAMAREDAEGSFALAGTSADSSAALKEDDGKGRNVETADTADSAAAADKAEFLRSLFACAHLLLDACICSFALPPKPGSLRTLLRSCLRPDIGRTCMWLWFMHCRSRVHRLRILNDSQRALYSCR